MLLLVATAVIPSLPAADYNGSVPVITYTTNTGSSSTLTLSLTAVEDTPDAVNDTTYDAIIGLTPVSVNGAESTFGGGLSGTVNDTFCL